jgi:nicotinate phosphoribosyltransferase
MIVNFAERAHVHNWELDPITRSLLDTDFYKLLMLQFIWKHFPTTRACFTLHNRTSSVNLATSIPRDLLVQHLEHIRTLRFARSELIWLAGNSFYGRRGIFQSEFIDWLEHDFRLCDYELTMRDGEYHLSFDGLWTQSTMWELYALSTINELRTRNSLKNMSEFEIDILYARAKTRLWGKIEQMRGVPGLRVADFGTRRRHSFLWQEYAVNAMATVLGNSFTGTSNTFLAYKHDLEAIGTNAHEIPMALAAMAPDDGALRQAQYRVLELWQQSYEGALLVMLPDTFGTTQFLEGAPEWVADWTGQRVDSKDPFVAGDEYIAWLQKHGRDPKQKLLIASDALDVNDILALHAYFSGTIAEGHTPHEFLSAADFLDKEKWTQERRLRFSAGWGTLLTNDFRGCHPQGSDTFDPISLVCKLNSAEGHAAVKLSDNYRKAFGPPEEVARYRRIFGTAGVADLPVVI